MAGVLFIINVPQKDHEDELRTDSTDKTKPCTIYDLQQNNKIGKSRESYSQDDTNIIISKCKSTDCLNSDKTDLHKTKSEVALNVNECVIGGKNYVKSSWEELKQVLKLKKNKLEITGPMRGIDILGAFHWDTPLETILLEVIARLTVKNATWNATRNNKFWQVTFSLESGYLCEELLQVLRTFGIGSRHDSSVCVVPCALYYDSNQTNESADSGKYENIRSNDTNSAWSRFSSSIRARTNLAQVLHDVRANAALTFDWLFLLVVAGFVAAIGLMENSTIILVASMLISPLMGPITAGTLGTAVRDRSLQYMGVMHELMGLFLCLVIGFVFGLAICAVDGRYGVVDDWPTQEMMARCEFRSLFVGVLIAVPSGACVALAVLSDYTSSLVGVAISASLLPPAVNAGLLWAMSLFRMVATNSELNWVVMAPGELAVLGTVSLCLTLINIICIFVTGVVVYKVKAVCPLERRDITWWRANRNRLDASKRGRDAPPSWNVYSKWSNDTSSSKRNIETIQSDTVTFRRPGVMQRKRAQSIEECFRNIQIDDSYQTLGSDTTEYESQSSNDQEKISNGSFGNYNFGYDNQEFIKGSSPIIEPSLNQTVEPKRNAAL